MDEVRAWRRELSDDEAGRGIRRNLRRDTQLEDCPSGRAALDLLVRRIATRSTHPTSSGSSWLKQVLESSPGDLLCQGRPVPVDPATDLVARTTALRGVATYLTASSVTITSASRLRRWARRFLTDPARARTVIDPNALVRGALPLVFACPEVDRQRQWPSGTTAADIHAVLGLPPNDPPADICVLRFSHTATSSHGRVPTGLDAYSHLYFHPAPAGTDWGWTRDLRGPAIPPALGVRECVVAAFPAEVVQDFEVVEA